MLRQGKRGGFSGEGKPKDGRRKARFERELEALAAEKARRGNSLSHENKWMAAVRKFETGQQLSAEMVCALVGQIAVYDGARVAITLKYRDELQALLGDIGGVQMAK